MPTIPEPLGNDEPTEAELDAALDAIAAEVVSDLGWTAPVPGWLASLIERAHVAKGGERESCFQRS